MKNKKTVTIDNNEYKMLKDKDKTLDLLYRELNEIDVYGDYHIIDNYEDTVAPGTPIYSVKIVNDYYFSFSFLGVYLGKQKDWLTGIKYHHIKVPTPDGQYCGMKTLKLPEYGTERLAVLEGLCDSRSYFVGGKKDEI